MYYPAPAAADPLVSPDYGGWWARGLGLLGRCFWPLVAVHLIGAVVAAVVQALLVVGAQLLSFQSNGLRGATAAASLLAFSLALRVALQAVATVAGVHVVVSRAAGAPVRVGAALRYALRRAVPLFAWEFVAGLLLVVAVLLLVVPSFYVGLVVLLLPAVVAFERGSPAVARCFRLFHASLGTALARTGTLGVLTVVGFILSQGIGVLLGNAAVLFIADLDTFLVVNAVLRTVFNTMLGTAVAVFTTPLLVTTYADLRGRAEGTTTPHLAHALGIHANGF